MIGYCVEYMMQTEENNQKTVFQQVCSTLCEAQRLAETLRWNQNVLEDTIRIKLS